MFQPNDAVAAAAAAAATSEVWVTVSTIYGNVIKVLVHPGMPILEFKSKCIEEDLWYGSPIQDCTPLAINVDLAKMMTERRHSRTDASPWQTDGRYNRFRLCTLGGDMMDDDGVLQPAMLTDNRFFKVQWMKQFNLRLDELAMLREFQINQSAGSMTVKGRYNTTFIAYPFYKSENVLLGLVYQHCDTLGHAEIFEEAQTRPMDPWMPAFRAGFDENGQLMDFTIVPGMAQSQ